MSAYFNVENKITIYEAVQNYFAEKEAIGGLSQASVRNRSFELNRFEKFCKSHNVEYTDDIHKNLLIFYLKDKKISKSSKLRIELNISILHFTP